MSRTNRMALLAASILMGPVATAAAAENNNGGNPNGNNGNHYGWYKDKNVDDEESRVIQVTEPEIFGLFTAGTTVLVTIALLRRRKR